MIRWVDRWLRDHTQIATNALSLYATTLVTSVLGFAFWLLAAHQFSTHEVGDAAALISLLQLVATASVLGLNTMVIGELSKGVTTAGPLLATSSMVVLVVSVAASVAVCIVGSFVSTTYSILLGNVFAGTVFTLATVATALTILLDDACIGVLQGRLQLHRNAFFSILKLALIPVMAVLIPRSHGTSLELTWLIATAVSLLFLRPLWRLGSTSHRIEPQLIRTYAGLALRHHWLNISLQAPRLAIPALAVSLVGTTATAGYYTAATIVGFISIIPMHFSTVLFALRAGDYGQLRREVRFTLSISTLVSAISVPVILVTAGEVLRTFGPAYVVARGAMVLLALTTLPSAFKVHYVAILRVQGRLLRAAVVTTVGVLVEVASAAAFSRSMGVTGLAFGLLIAQVAEAVWFGPAVLRMVFGRSAPSGRVEPPKVQQTAAAGG